MDYSSFGEDVRGLRQVSWSEARALTGGPTRPRVRLQVRV